MSTKALNGPVGPRFTRPYTGPASLTYGIGLKQGATDGACLAVTASGQKCLGILEETDVTGKGTHSIVTFGETLAIAGAAIGADVECIIDATGRLAASTAQADNVIGRTRSSSTAADQEVVLFVCPYIR